MGKFNEKKFGSEFKNILRIIKIENIIGHPNHMKLIKIKGGKMGMIF